MVTEQQPDEGNDDALERCAAFDELLRNNLRAPVTDTSPALPGSGEMPTAGVIRLLHEVFRAPRGASVASDERVPDRIGRFVIQRMLGRGAFGRVYLAHDPVLRRQVALKVFHQHLLADDSKRRHVLREREIMARLQHPNIVPVWEAGEDDEQLYIASEYCPGPTLAQWLADREQAATSSGHAAAVSAASLRQCAGWIARLADAVQHSHERGVVHRDLKPGNVLLEPQGSGQAEGTPGDWRPRLTDFGLAKYFEGVQDETRSGLFVGSLEYASPEQVRGQPEAVGPASDIYSLGVLLFELLTDSMPHTADSDYDLARKICEQDVAFSPEHRRALPADLQAITLRALERQPRDRYASAAAMRDDLQRFLAGEFVMARSVSMRERLLRCARRNPDVAVLSGLCICFALLLLVVLVRHNQQLVVHSSELKQALVDIREQHHDAQMQRATARQMQQRAEESERRAQEVGYLANMRLAYEAWEKNNLVDARKLLEQTATQAPGLRGPDWYLLQRELAARYKTFPRMESPFYGVVSQPKSHMLLAVSESGQVHRLDLDTRTLTEEFQTRGGVHAVALAPDGRTLAIGYRSDSPLDSNSLGLWDAQQRKLSRPSLHYHATTIESIEYSPDGKWLASGPRYEPVIVTHLETGESFTIASERRNSQVAFSAASDRLAVNSLVSTIDVYELATHEKKLAIKTAHSRVASHAWLPDRELIAANFFDGTIQLYSSASGDLVATLPTSLTGESLTASDDGRRLALGTNEGRLQVFDVPDVLGTVDSAGHAGGNGPEASPASAALVEPPASLQVLSGFVTDLEFVGESKIAAADDLGNLAYLDLTAHAYRSFLRKEACWTSARWEDEDSLSIFSVQRAPEVQSLSGAPPQGSSFPVSVPIDTVLSADGQLRATFSQSGQISVVDVASGEERFQVHAEPGNASGHGRFVILAATFAADNALLLTTGDNNRLTAWNTADGTIAWEELLTNSGRAIAEDSSTGRLFVGGNFESLRIYDSRTGKFLLERFGGNGTTSLVIDSAGGRIISGHFDGSLRVRDLALSRRATIQRSHGRELTAMTLSPDGRTILTGDAAGTIRVWSADGQLLGAIYRSQIPEPRIQKLLWSPSGSQLAAVIAGGTDISEVVCWQLGQE